MGQLYYSSTIFFKLPPKFQIAGFQPCNLLLQQLLHRSKSKKYAIKFPRKGKISEVHGKIVTRPRTCTAYDIFVVTMWGNCKYVSTWTSVVDGPPPRAQISSACITSNCCLIRCISAAIGSRLTVGLFWIFRARLAYFKVLRVSSAFESAGLTQAA